MRLNFPQKLAMSKICVQYAYFDIFSEEVGTGNVKAKYKICCQMLPIKEIYAFYITTSDSLDRYKNINDNHPFILRIHEEHWEDRETSYLKGTGYLDVNVKIHTTQELLDKMTDEKNCFKVVGRLCDERFLLAEAKRVKNAKRPNSSPNQELRNKVFVDEYKESIDDIIKQSSV